MTQLRRIVLLRHGDTVGNSKERFPGSSDVALSDEGRQQVRDAAAGMAREVFDLVVASPLRRSWESARIASGGAPVRLEPGFREVHFGRWEGLTAAEIEAQDPALYADWQAKSPGFEYPVGRAARRVPGAGSRRPGFAARERRLECPRRGAQGCDPDDRREAPGRAARGTASRTSATRSRSPARGTVGSSASAGSNPEGLEAA